MDLADRLLSGAVCALLWYEAAAGVQNLRPVELRALQQLYNVTGGPQGAWRYDAGWRGGAPDPCDGRSWFGIYNWSGYGGLGLEVEACTEPDKATGWRSLQVLSLGAAANAAGAGNLGNGLRGNLGEWSMLRELGALRGSQCTGHQLSWTWQAGRITTQKKLIHTT